MRREELYLADIVHAYFAVDWTIVWVAGTRDAPELRRRVADILAKEYRSAP